MLRVALARLVAGEPLPGEHDVVRWLRPDQLDEVGWLAADRPFLPDGRRAGPQVEPSVRCARIGAT